MAGGVRNLMGRVFAAFAAPAGAALLVSCGGGGGGGGTSLSFPVSVKVAGLTQGTLQLVEGNGNDSVTVDGSSTTTTRFPTQIAAGSLYYVKVVQQPQGMNCVVLGGAGAANGNVIVNVVCSPSSASPAPAAAQWTWMAGFQMQSPVGSYGAVGVPGGFPGARYGAASWTDEVGNLWLFGGDTVVSGSAVGFFNDLWKYDTASGTWTWWGPAVSANTPYQAGVSIADSGYSSYPGARIFASTWFNTGTGQAWLFGGYGCGEGSGACSSSTVQLQNDLWTFTPSGGWTLVPGGSSSSPNSYPGARFGAATWIDSGGNLWLFGGSGVAVDGTSGDLGDLWEYNPRTKTWTKVSGPSSASTTPPSGTNTCSQSSPPARQNAASWFDGANLWLFGGAVGSGSYSSSTETFYADLWEYVPSSGSWKCWPGNPPVAGGNSLSYTPAARYEAVSWVDPNTHYFWLYGGEGYTGPGAGNGTPGYFNDLWYFDPKALSGSPGIVQQWTQVSVSDTEGGCTTMPGGSNTGVPPRWCPGIYGSQGASATSNLPGARYGSVGWVDANGDFWLFGGDGYGVGSQSVGSLNDLWRYTP